MKVFLSSIRFLRIFLLSIYVQLYSSSLTSRFFLFLSVCVMETGIMSPDVLKKALPFVADNKSYTRLKGNFENQF